MTAFHVTLIAFALVTTALVALEALARRTASWPQIGDVFTVLMRRPTGRFLVVLGWWWLGWHFFVR
jgi:Family of unknown function (DUF6186)